MIIFYYLVILLFLVLSFIALILGVSLIVGLIMVKGVPFISTPKNELENICRAADLQPGQVVYDLGCGKANLLVVASKQFGAKGVGYELSLWPYLWARVRVWFYKADAEVLMKDFFQADLSRADAVFCYLFPEVMAKLEKKFKSELKSGAKVVSYAFQLSNVTPVKIVSGNSNKKSVGQIYVYQF